MTEQPEEDPSKEAPRTSVPKDDLRRKVEQRFQRERKPEDRPTEPWASDADRPVASVTIPYESDAYPLDPRIQENFSQLWTVVSLQAQQLEVHKEDLKTMRTAAREDSLELANGLTTLAYQLKGALKEINRLGTAGGVINGVVAGLIDLASHAQKVADSCIDQTADANRVALDCQERLNIIEDPSRGA